MFITLTDASGRSVLVNTDQVCYVSPANTGTVVVFAAAKSDTAIRANFQESMDEVSRLMGTVGLVPA